MAWEDLPIELLVLIAVTLPGFTDQIRFSSVCSRWRSAFRSLLPQLPQLPWLLLPTPSSTLFYSFSDDRIYSSRLPEDAKSSYLSGSGSGWLLALKGGNEQTFSMMNPFTSASIRLPSPDRDYLPNVYSGSLVWDRSDSNVVTACAFKSGGGVCYCTLGTHSWNQTESMLIIAESITFYKGKFYILDNFSKIIVLEGDTFEIIRVINPPNWEQPHDRKVHLIVSEESLMLLESSVSVYEMNLNGELEEWSVIDDIGNRAIFLDNSHCFLVEVNERNNLRRNCIYRPKSKIVSDSGGRMFEIFLVNLGNGEGEKLECALSTFVVAPPPQGGDFKPSTWFLPSLN